MKNSTYSQRVSQVFYKNSKYRKSISILYIVLMLVYLGWRLTTFNDNYLIISLVYYFAEIMGLILGLVIVFNSWDISYKPKKYTKTCYTVDVFVPVYKEDLSIIEKTLRAAKGIGYPHQTWVLDDAKRDDVRELADKLSIKYLSREKNLGAKAGNINNALERSTSELIVVFDADHIPQPDSIEKLLGYFDDDQVSMVQTPQDYYNSGAFQYMNSHKSKQQWHDQSFFYNISLSCSNNHNAASCVGTGVVYRRSALLDIGGIPSSTITEDIHTSLKLHKAGYKSIYVNEPIAYGLAATDLEEYYITRHRWAHGNINVLKDEKILSCSGLTWKQRLSYLSLGLIYLEGWQQFILFMIPIAALFLGIPPFEISLFNILIILFFPFVAYFLLQEIGSGFSRFWANEIYSMIRWPVHIVASLALIGKKLEWKSSKKKIKGELNFKLMLPQLFILLISVAALLFASYKVINDPVVSPIYDNAIDVIESKGDFNTVSMTEVMDDGYSLELVVVAGFWAFFNIFKVILFFIKVFRSSVSSDEKLYFNLRIPFKLNGRVFFCERIGEDYLVIKNHGDLRKGEIHNVDFIFPTGSVSAGIKFSKYRKNHKLVKGSITWNEVCDGQLLSDFLYSPDWYRDAFLRNEVFLTPVGFLLYPVKYIFNRVQLPLVWKADILQCKGKEYFCLLGERNQRASVICFQTLTIGRIITIGSTSFIIKDFESIASIPGKGLHNHYHFRYSLEVYVTSLAKLSEVTADL